MFVGLINLKTAQILVKLGYEALIKDKLVCYVRFCFKPEQSSNVVLRTQLVHKWDTY